MIVLIPAFRPTNALPALVRELRRQRPALEVLVVDDGSGHSYASVFDDVRDAGGRVVAHTTNHGKGAALRTGIDVIRQRHPGHGVVCADADGQHEVSDVLAVLDETAAGGEMTLGVRALDHDVPLRSRVGNTVTSRIFRWVTGRALADTQTGLRGYPAPLLGWLTAIPGDRYEYELSVLLRATREGIGWRTIPIRTIYADGNATSHFRPVLDSMRICVPMFAFAGSSLLAFGVDALALLVLYTLTGTLVGSVLGARVVSAATNFAVNRRFVFSRGRSTPIRQAVLRYALLALVLVASSFLMLRALTGLGVPLLAAKIVSDLVLFLLSYAAQRRVVFAGVPDRQERTDPSRLSQESPSPVAGR